MFSRALTCITKVQVISVLPVLNKQHYSKMVDNFKKVLASVAEISTFKQATITNVLQKPSGGKDIAVEILWNSPNLTASERTLHLSNYIVQNGKITSYHPAPISKNMSLRQTSNSGKSTACIMTSEKDKDSQYLIVMKADGCMTTIDLKGEDKHGKVYADDNFSCLEWSPDESTLVYVAEKKYPKPTSFFSSPKKGSEEGRGEEYIHRDDWGERLRGKYQTVVCFLNVNTKELRCHELPDEMCPAQLVWAPDGAGVIGVAFESRPYRLGLMYCQNRASKLFHMDLSGDFTVISQGCSNIRSPRVSPDGKKIAYLRTEVGGPHAKCSQLCLMSWASKKEQIVVDVVEREKRIADDHVFYGIYSDARLPRRCWLKDSERLLLSTISHCDLIAYVVYTNDGTIVELPHTGTHEVVDVFDDHVLINFSTVTRPNQILLGHVPEKGQEACIDLKEVTAARTIPSLSGMEYSVFEFKNDTPHPIPKYSDIPVSLLYYGPVSNKTGASKRPLICWPHGGPHSASCNSYMMGASFLVALGYSVVFVNYRGSLGFGQDGVNSLPGHCGLTDVDDVHKATLHCLKRFSDVLDESQVFLLGGSHGGFLVSHLAAQYPDFYKAVVSRNPVIDIASMSTSSDITCWTFVECGFTYEHGKVADAATLGKMLAMSPISKIDSIKVPILLLVGKNDARVPPSQSFNFHRLLLARGVETKLFAYEDNHALSEIEVEVDCLMHIALWFEKYVTKTN